MLNKEDHRLAQQVIERLAQNQRTPAVVGSSNRENVKDLVRRMYQEQDIALDEEQLERELSFLLNPQSLTPPEEPQRNIPRSFTADGSEHEMMYRRMFSIAWKPEKRLGELEKALNKYLPYSNEDFLNFLIDQRRSHFKSSLVPMALSTVSVGTLGLVFSPWLWVSVPLLFAGWWVTLSTSVLLFTRLKHWRWLNHQRDKKEALCNVLVNQYASLDLSQPKKWPVKDKPYRPFEPIELRSETVQMLGHIQQHPKASVILQRWYPEGFHSMRQFELLALWDYITRPEK